MKGETDFDVIGTRAPSPGVNGLPLFAESDQAAAEKAREAGIHAAHEHADEQWKQTAYAAIVSCARRLAKLTSDDVWQELKGATPHTHNPSALGPLFRIAASRKVIEKTGEQVPTRQAQRHRDLTVWESLILDG